MHPTRAATLQILSDLIGFPTVSSDSNLALIDYAAEYLGKLGANVHTFRAPDGTKVNLFATIGPEVDGGIVLSGHSDVVPVTDQAWSSDPFGMRVAEGKAYGRGTCDMKGFIAAALAMAPHYAKNDLRRPVHFAFTYDEEVGCLGAQALMHELALLPFKPAVCIIGEPTEMRIIEGHKGCCEYTVTFSGLEGHGSQPDHVTRLMELREVLKGRAPAGSRFDPPWTSLQIGRLSGGVAHNVIPGLAQLDWEMRPVQNGDADFVKREIAAYVNDDLLPAMRAVSKDADISTEIIGEVDGLEPVPESEALNIVAELTGANGADLVAFGTEAGLFQKLGISTVVCGPGSIDQAHKPDEYIALDGSRAPVPINSVRFTQS